MAPLDPCSRGVMQVLARLGLALFASVATLLIAEGVLSLSGGTTLRSLLADKTLETAAPLAQRDEERFRAAASLPGPYRVHDDPRVGYVLRSETNVAVEKITVATDGLGLRQRPGPPPSDDAIRIAVVGDSVAFGWNLADEETLAAQLERLLNEARDAGLPRVCAWTVAVPGWNATNATSFLLDHFDEIRPHHVVYIPVENDLEDGDGVYETGHRRNRPDIVQHDPWVNVNQGQRFLTLTGARIQKATGVPPTLTAVGPSALNSDLGPTSQARHDAHAATLIHAAQRLEHLGCSFHLAAIHPHNVQRHLRARLITAKSAIPEVPLLRRYLKSDTQIDDGHPNATTIEWCARWIAKSWIDEGVIESSRPVETKADERRDTLPSAEECLAWANSDRTAARDALHETIDLRTGQGIRQILGGVRPDGSMAPRLLALLAPSGHRLRVELAPLDDRPDLLPVSVRVVANGIEVGTMELTHATRHQETVFPLNPAPDAPFEVKLIADHWGVVAFNGKSSTSACRLLGLTCE